MDEKGRIEKIMEVVQLNSGQFAIQIGIQNSTLSHILNNRNKPSLEVLKKILQRFPSISSDWLILGQGAMFRPEFKSQERSLFDEIEESTSLSTILINKNKENSVLDSPSENVEMLKSEEPPLYGHKTESKPDTSLIQTGEKKIIESVVSNSPGLPEFHNSKNVTKIILYFSDNTFQEFESK